MRANGAGLSSGAAADRWRNEDGGWPRRLLETVVNQRPLFERVRESSTID